MITVERTFDTEIIRSIMTRDDIWSTVAEDGQHKEGFNSDPVVDCWLLIKSNGEIVGLYKLHTENCVTLQIHAQVLPEHRKAYSNDTGTSVLQWIYDNAEEYKKVIACVPVIYRNVKDFTCSFGFLVEGTNRKSYLKDGELHDQWNLGITRDEIEVALNG